MTREVIGERIKTFRVARAMSQGALAELLDVTQQAIDRYERGIVDIPTSRMFQLAEHLGCTVSDLLGETPDATEVPA